MNVRTQSTNRVRRKCTLTRPMREAIWLRPIAAGAPDHRPVSELRKRASYSKERGPKLDKFGEQRVAQFIWWAFRICRRERRFRLSGVSPRVTSSVRMAKGDSLPKTNADLIDYVPAGTADGFRPFQERGKIAVATGILDQTLHIRAEINAAMDGLNVRFRGTDADSESTLVFDEVPGAAKGSTDREALMREIIQRLYELQANDDAILTYLKAVRAIKVS